MQTNPIPITPSLARLVTEAGVAGANLGLKSEVGDILASLPDWIDDPALQAECEALLLLGLHRPTKALARLAQSTGPQSEALRCSIDSTRAMQDAVAPNRRNPL